MPRFELSLANDKIWEIEKLIRFLNTNSGKDICLLVNPEAHSLSACGLYDLLDCFVFRSVTIETLNCLECHEKYKIVKYPVDNFLSKTYWAGYNLDSSGIWNRDKIFGVFYGRPTANRIGIASYLFSKYRSKSHIIFAGNSQDADERQLFEIDKLFQYRPESINDFSQLLLSRYNQKIDYTKFGHEYNPNTILHDGYKSILIDIISEPNIQGTTFFPTEKFSRCVLMKKPFIAMASLNYISYLRQMGFRSFYQYWDETYDGFACENRFEKILSVIDDIAGLTSDQIESMYHDMKDILEHNYNILTSQKYKIDIKEIL